MENSMFQRIVQRKSLIIGLGVLVLASVFLVVLNTSGQNQTTPTPTSAPNPTSSEQPIIEESTIPPDEEIEGQLIVDFRDQYTDAQINEHLKQYNAEIRSTIEGVNLKVISVPKGQEETIRQRLENDPYVESAERDSTNHIMYTPNDPLFGNQYGLKNTGQTINNVTGTAGADIKAEAAWDVTRGNGVKVAVLDTGINVNHPDFAGKIIAQRGFATTTVEDQNGHGTHVAGTITSATNNGQGIAGTCPDCQLIVGKVMGDNGSGSTSNIASGITWAADQGAKVISLSLGTVQQSSSNTYQTAIDYAISKGAVVVAAAGNCGGSNFANNGCSQQNQISYPGANNGVITVASTDNKDAKSAFSNFGNHVEVAAPGSNILSTGPNHSFAKQPANYNFSNPYYYTSGTSMATPMVAGVTGLIWSSQYGTNAQAVINRLYATVDKIGGTGQYWTQGRVNAAKAVGAGTATAAPSPSAVTPTYVCAGSPSGNVCPPTPAGGTGVTLVPSGYNGGGSPQPSNGVTIPIGGQNPTLFPNPSTQPCVNDAEAGIQDSKSRVKSLGGFLEQFFRFIFQLIQYFLQQLGIQIPGGGNPNPGNPNPGNPNPGNPVPTQTPGGNPNPTGSPCPQPTTAQPTQPAPSSAPTTGITLVPSTAPSQGAAPTTAPAGNSPSGQAMPTGDLPGWKLIFSDDFTKDAPIGSWGSECDAQRIAYTGAQGQKWRSYPNCFKDTYQKRPYRADQVLSVKNGVLNFFLHPVDGQPAGANPSPLIDGSQQYQTYGRYVARFKTDNPNLKEYYAAWLLWPQSEKWGPGGDGEIDFPEGSLGGNVGGFHHCLSDTSKNCGIASDTGAKFTEWHTYVIEWTPNYVKFILDGKEVLNYTNKAEIPNKPMRWQLQTETNGSGSSQGNLMLDWVAVYKYQP